LSCSYFCEFTPTDWMTVVEATTLGVAVRLNQHKRALTTGRENVIQLGNKQTVVVCVITDKM